MSSEATHEVALVAGNARRQAKGLWALGGFDDPRSSRTQCREYAYWGSGLGGRPDVGGVHVSKHFSLTAYGKACR